MSLINLYKIVFFDSLTSYLFFTLDYEYLVYIVYSFNQLNIFESLFVASCGYAMAISLNYLFGLLIYKIYIKKISQKIKERYDKTLQFVNKYFYILILLSLINGFGKFLFVVFGFTNYRFAHMLLLGCLVRISYYILKIYAI